MAAVDKPRSCLGRLQDFWRFTLGSGLGFCAGCTLCFAGVALITFVETEKPVDKLRRTVTAVRKLSGVLGNFAEALRFEQTVAGQRPPADPRPVLFSGPGAALVQASRRDLFAQRRPASASSMLM